MIRRTCGQVSLDLEPSNGEVIEMDEKVFYSERTCDCHESNDKVLLFNKKEDYEIAVQLM